MKCKNIKVFYVAKLLSIMWLLITSSTFMNEAFRQISIWSKECKCFTLYHRDVQKFCRAAAWFRRGVPVRREHELLQQLVVVWRRLQWLLCRLLPQRAAEEAQLKNVAEARPVREKFTRNLFFSYFLLPMFLFFFFYTPLRLIRQKKLRRQESITKNLRFSKM